MLLKKGELVTDLTNVMYRQTDAVEKLTKIKADSDKQMVRDMKQIKDLAADCDQKAQQLADLEAAAQVVIGMVEDEEAGGKVRWSVFVNPTSDSVASSPTPLGNT